MHREAKRGVTSNEAIAAICKKYFETLLNSSRTNSIDNFVNQNLNNHENFKDITNIMCGTYRLAALIQKLHQSLASGRDEILAEHIT